MENNKDRGADKPLARCPRLGGRTLCARCTTGAVKMMLVMITMMMLAMITMTMMVMVAPGVWSSAAAVTKGLLDKLHQQGQEWSEWRSAGAMANLH